MYNEIPQLIAQSWARIEPTLLASPAALAARLARRRLGLFRRAPRPWCLALRAADRRIDPWCIEMRPSRPVVWGDDHKIHRRDHDVILDAKWLKWLCLPFSMPWPGETVNKIAELLGTDVNVIRRAMKKGIFSVRITPGVRGRPEAFIYTPNLIDPANIDSPHANDPAWGTIWRYPAESIPPDMTVTLARSPATRLYRGQQRFTGWKWICPACKRHVDLLFCPMPGPKWVDFVNWNPTGSPDETPQPLSTFACVQCHQVLDHGRLDSRGWNDLITFLTAGLLFGREVPKPQWWTPHRRRPYHPRTGLRSPTGKAVLNFLTHTTLTSGQIAWKLQTPTTTVLSWIGVLYKRHNVHSRKELKEKLATPATP